jgi:hypothetical protein
MKIASRRTLPDMDFAAELRVQGATWDTIAQYLGRHKRVLTRWVRYYAADWARLFVLASAISFPACSSAKWPEVISKHLRSAPALSR